MSSWVIVYNAYFIECYTILPPCREIFRKIYTHFPGLGAKIPSAAYFIFPRMRFHSGQYFPTSAQNSGLWSICLRWQSS